MDPEHNKISKLKDEKKVISKSKFYLPNAQNT